MKGSRNEEPNQGQPSIKASVLSTMKPPTKLKPLDIHEIGAELPTNSGRNNQLKAFPAF